ncbi:TonB-dependent receptor [Aquimarina agarivorans]|uniref:TonB-dependent receptor n=1 Tax=Aquimarina agarivorans TaxID=980584 RepID=UPI00031E826F|nr:TonB-dependent receptor [Aquimarina agarivorans]
MKLIVLFIFVLVASQSIVAQTQISGKVTDQKGNPLSGANIFLVGSYDGATSDTVGKFNFTTDLEGTQKLQISFISFEDVYLNMDVSAMQNLQVKLKQSISSLEQVVLSAGSMDASDNSKAAVLTPMDIVTTAGALGDAVGALQTLPGTSSNANDGRLFVRGGDASETQVFIDGTRVFQPFLATANNTPTRGRNSPFVFKGVNFSTGGYSAEYGQALSSILNLETVDEPNEEEVNLQLMSVGGGAQFTKIWDKSSLIFNTSYFNLKPYQEIIKQQLNFSKPIQVLSGETVFTQKFKKGLLKTYAALSYTDFELTQEDINVPQGVFVGLKNRNSYLNTTYKGKLGNSWKVNGGISLSNDFTDTKQDVNRIKTNDNSLHAKLKLNKKFDNNFQVSFGAEQFVTRIKDKIAVPNQEIQNSTLNNNISAAFAEGKLRIGSKFVTKFGARASHAGIFSKTTLAPRFSLAHKTSEYGQLAFAYGNFYQNPQNAVLKIEESLSPERASHFLLNYLYKKERQIFRAELFYKKYTDLIKFNGDQVITATDFRNSGNGNAKGLDLFWRDGKSIKNFEYWISYSYLDTKRNF